MTATSSPSSIRASRTRVLAVAGVREPGRLLAQARARARRRRRRRRRAARAACCDQPARSRSAANSLTVIRMRAAYPPPSVGLNRGPRSSMVGGGAPEAWDRSRHGADWLPCRGRRSRQPGLLYPAGVATADRERSTESGIPLKPVYRAQDAPPERPAPGAFPYTRGVRPDGYRERPWTMRQYAGFSSAEETNSRFRLLLDRGQTGLSVAFDLPTQLGLDSDDPLARGEVGRTGVAIDSIADMRALLAGIPLDTVSTSMTINAPAALLLLLYELVAEEQGVAPGRAHGHDPKRRPQGVHRPRQLHLPRPAEHAPHRGHLPLLHRAAAALQHDLDLRLPHPRGGLDRGAGDRVHARKRHRLRAGGRRRRPRGGRLRPPAVVLLQRAQQLLPGGGEVPGGAHASGPR